MEKKWYMIQERGDWLTKSYFMVWWYEEAENK
jgi:hypothetical protein